MSPQILFAFCFIGKARNLGGFNYLKVGTILAKLLGLRIFTQVRGPLLQAGVGPGPKKRKNVG